MGGILAIERYPMNISKCKHIAWRLTRWRVRQVALKYNGSVNQVHSTSVSYGGTVLSELHRRRCRPQWIIQLYFVEAPIFINFLYRHSCQYSIGLQAILQMQPMCISISRSVWTTPIANRQRRLLPYLRTRFGDHCIFMASMPYYTRGSHRTLVT